MKIRLPRKSKNIEDTEKPKKGFEEFAIDPDILEELDELPEVEETALKNEQIINENNIKEDVEIIESNINPNIIDASSSEFINIVRDNIDFCTKEIKEISSTMDKIEAQKNTESFWKKSENIRTISKHVNKMSDIQQKTLDLLVMFLGASGKMADDYDTILKTIDELGELHGGETEVLNYLLKVKRMIKEIKNNDERLKALQFDNELLKKKTEELDKKYKEKTESYEKNSKLTVSKLYRLNTKLNRQSLAIFISYILIIAMAVVFYLKVFKGA